MATYYRLQHVGNVSYTDQLSGSITSSATTFSLVSGSTFPDGSVGDFVVTIDPDTASEEKILCSSRSGSTFTVATSGRGWDGTTAIAHNANASVIHTLSAAELDWANQLVNLLLVNLGTANQIPASNGTTINWESPLTLAETMFGAAGQLLAGTGSGTGELLSKGSSGQVLKVGGSDSSGLEWDGVGLLGSVMVTDSANPSVSGTTWSVFDASKFTVSFVAPASGSVLVRLSAWNLVSGSGSSPVGFWAVMDHTGGTVEAASAVTTVAPGTAVGFYGSAAFKITGLTAGSTYQYDWGGATSASGLYLGMQTGTTGVPTPGSNYEGPAVMEVWAA